MKRITITKILKPYVPLSVVAAVACCACDKISPTGPAHATQNAGVVIGTHGIIPEPKMPSWLTRAMELYMEGDYAGTISISKGKREQNPLLQDRVWRLQHVIRRCHLALGHPNLALKSFVESISGPSAYSSSEMIEESAYYLQVAIDQGDQQTIDQVVSFARQVVEPTHSSFQEVKSYLGSSTTQIAASILAMSATNPFGDMYPVSSRQAEHIRMTKALELNPEGIVPLYFGAYYYGKYAQKYPGLAARLCRKLIANAGDDEVIKKKAYMLCERAWSRGDAELWKLKQELIRDGKVRGPSHSPSVTRSASPKEIKRAIEQYREAIKRKYPNH